ncbi:MAG: sigma-70 family RNA polymerase sigma factor [Planctomycetes bacterium]|nr:sigma-70 family RNA polymerase sigma factor [Planctomycetota bacterium]
MSEPATAQFVRTLTAHQARLYAYILSLVGDSHAANDILQETNVVLWEKAAQAMAADDFAAWAFRVAHFQLLAWRQKQGRDRLVFNEAVLNALSDRAAALAQQTDARQDALTQCLADLPANAARLIHERYVLGRSVSQIADAIHRSVAATHQWLYRLRRELLACIESKINREEAP